MAEAACTLSYSEPSLAADLFGPGKQAIHADGTMKPVSLQVPVSPTSTVVPSPGISPTIVNFPAQDADWLTRHLSSLRGDLKAAALDLEPQPAFMAAPGQGQAQPQEEPCNLRGNVVALEADVKRLLAEAECWRHRCLELEKDRATALAAEDKAQLELRSVQERERDLAAQSLELRLSRQDAENAAARSAVTKQQQELELKEMEDKLKEQETQLEAARLELADTLSTSAAQRRRQEHELRERGEQVESARTEAAVARVGRREADEALHSATSELETTKLVLRGARASQKKQEEELQAARSEIEQLQWQLRDREKELARRETQHEELEAKKSELERIRQQLSDVISDRVAARAAHKEELQAKELELVKVRQELQELRTQQAELEGLRQQLSETISDRVAARVAHREELQAKDSELARVRQELQDSLTNGLARRAVHKEEMQAKEAELAAARAEAREALNDSIARRSAQSQTAKDLEVKEQELTIARRELREALHDSYSSREALTEERKRNRELETRVQSLEGALASATARRADLAREAAYSATESKRADQAERVLEDERQRGAVMKERINNLEASLKVASVKEADLTREAQLYRSHGEHQELVSHKLRLDLQDALGATRDTVASPTHRPTSANRLGPLSGHAAVAPGPPRSARIDVPPPPPLPQGRMEYPRSSVSRRLRKEVLTARGPDRTHALSRYDSKGHLVSYDSHGRAIQ